MDKRKAPVGAAETHTLTSAYKATDVLLSEPTAPPSDESATHPDYDIGEEIARGGMGRIVAAYDRKNVRTIDKSR